MATRQTTQYAPKDEKNTWRVDTFMNTDEWKEVSRWYPFSLRSLMPDGRWAERARCKTRDHAYEIMKALAGAGQRGYFVIVQCTLVGNDGREKAVVFSGGSEQTILHERARRIAQGWDTPAADTSPEKAHGKAQTENIRQGECAECGRFSLQLSENGYCEGCIMQAAIDAMAPEER